MNALGLHRKKEETLALISEENVRKNPAKPWISNRQIYVGSGTMLTLVYLVLSGWGFEHPRCTTATRKEVGPKFRERFSLEPTYQ